MAEQTSESDQNPQALLLPVRKMRDDVIDAELGGKDLSPEEYTTKTKELLITFADLDASLEYMMRGKISQDMRNKLSALTYSLSRVEDGSSNLATDMRAVLRLPPMSASEIPELPDDLQHAYTISSALPPDNIRLDPSRLPENGSVMGVTGVITPSEAAETKRAAARPAVPPTFEVLRELRSKMLKHAGGYDAVSWGRS